MTSTATRRVLFVCVENSNRSQMGCGDECPSLRARRREDWNLPDPKHLIPEKFAQVRDEIESRVKSMLKPL